MTREPVRRATLPRPVRPRVLLLLDAAGDRRVVSAWLGEHHELREPTQGNPLSQEFDLCVLDDAAYAKWWPQVAESKQKSEPVFLPFVLLTSKRTAHLVADVPKHDIDEVLEAPVHPDVLVSRVGVLLRRRLREQAVQSQLDERLRLAEMLNEADQLLLSSPDREDIFSHILQVASQALHADYGVVSLKGDTAWRIAYAFDAPMEVGTVLSADRAKAAEEIAQSREPFISEDALGDQRLDHDFIQKLAVRAFIHVPLIVADRAIGLMSFHNVDEPRPFTPGEVSFAEHIAASVSLALESSRAFSAEQTAKRDAQQQLETANALLDSAHSMAEWTDIQIVVEQLALNIQRATGRRRIWVQLWDETRRTTRSVVSLGEKAPPVGAEFEFDKFAAPAKRAFTEGLTTVIDVDELSEEEQGAYLKEFGFRRLLIAMIVHGSDLIGVVTADDPDERRPFDEREIAVVEGIAAQAGIAIENARLYAIERETARLNEALASIDQSLQATMEPEEMLQRAVVEAAGALGCESCVLDLREHGKWVIRYVFQFPEEAVGSAFTDKQVPFAALAAREREPIVVNDAFTDPRVDPEIQKVYKVRSVMAAPLVVRDEVQGVLFFNYHESFHTFTQQEIVFARRLSAALGLSVENSRLYQAEHEIADRLQEALLALPQEVPGIEFAHAYHSATESARVGGDFYDVFELRDDRVGVVIGDVAGKGVDAAVLTSMVKNTIRAHANERGKKPSQILDLTNDVIYKATATESFVTVFFGIIDHRTGQLVYGNAGHTTAAIVGADGGLRDLNVTGPLLGAFDDVEFGQAEDRLGLDELLFLYTDGLTEARSNGDMYGEPRVFEKLQSAGGTNPASVVEHMVADVLSFTGNKLRDDLAILSVKRVGRGVDALPQRQLDVDVDSRRRGL